MDDELRRRLANARERVSDGTPDIGAVVSSARKRKVLRGGAGLLATTTVVVSVILAVTTLTGSDLARQDDGDVANHEDGVFVPAQKGEPTYELYDFEIHYPWAPVDRLPAGQDHYCETHGEWACGHRREQAGFAYQWRWATSKFPGTVECHVTLFGRDGSAVGQETWEMSGLETQSRPNRRGFVLTVHVSGRPSEAEALCEAGDYAKGRGLRVTFVRAESYTPSAYRGETPPPDRIRLIFEAEGLAQDHIDSRMCFMTVWFESGEKKSGKFTTNQRPGTWEYETGYPASDPVVDARIRCRALRASDSR